MGNEYQVFVCRLINENWYLVPKNISWRKLVQKFRKLGFDGPYSGGRHLFMVKGDLKVRIPNPHRGDISVSLVEEILRQASISKSAWDKRKPQDRAIFRTR